MFYRQLIIYYLVITTSITSFAQDPSTFKNAAFLKNLDSDRSYTQLRNKVIIQFGQKSAGHWGEFVKGCNEKINTSEKIVAFTFDACGGKNGDGYDKDLIDYLVKEKIPATLFVTGKWIDSHFAEFLALSKIPVLEIENHGLRHHPCSADGESAYGIKGTASIGEAFDEVEGNARKIEAITGRRPLFFRSATAFMDEASAQMVASLGMTPVSYSILSGDAVPLTEESVIEENVIKKIKPGAIIIMHFNHPEWNTKEALEKIIPRLRKSGYKFALLEDFKLSSMK